MISRLQGRVLSASCIAAGLALALFVYGAIPFFSLPTVGQAVWTTSFAQSIANQSLLALTANNFGLPAPAGISFGLSAAYPIAAFIWMGVAPPDAYTLVFALWLACAFAGAFGIAKRFVVSRPICALLATTWLCLPIVWLHASYSMLSLGIALLPAYFYSLFLLLGIGKNAPPQGYSSAILIIFSALVSVFMDGYTFVMFGAGTVVFFAYRWIAEPAERKRLARLAAPSLAAAFGLAYLCYKRYVGPSEFWIAPLEAFRAWGVDLSFLIEPTKGVSWILDSAHFSEERTVDTWFGDTSVWETTFLLPLILLSIIAFVTTRKHSGLAHTAILLALCALYMSFGPSLKAWSEKTDPAQQVLGDTHFMSAADARFSTHTALLSMKVPGLNSMRASYRWLALGAFGFWFVIVLLHGALRGRSSRLLAIAATIIVLLLNLPPPHEHVENITAFRKMFFSMDNELMGELESSVHAGEKTAFIPHSNDFLIAYLSARSRTFTYNIGGDKNVGIALAHWPTSLAEIPTATMPDDLGERAYELLLGGYTDVIVVPYFLEPMAAHYWPCPQQVVEKFSRRIQKSYGLGWPCPDDYRGTYSNVLAQLSADPRFKVSQSAHFAFIRLPPPLLEPGARARQLGEVVNQAFAYPIAVNISQSNLRWLLPDGWYAPEPTSTWSSYSAKLRLPMPARCLQSSCTAVINFKVFGADLRHPVTVSMRKDIADRWAAKKVILDDASYQQSIPLSGRQASETIDIDVAGAKTPNQRYGMADMRPLGVLLSSIDIAYSAQAAPAL